MKRPGASGRRVVLTSLTPDLDHSPNITTEYHQPWFSCAVASVVGVWNLRKAKDYITGLQEEVRHVKDTI